MLSMIANLNPKKAHRLIGKEYADISLGLDAAQNVCRLIQSAEIESAEDLLKLVGEEVTCFLAYWAEDQIAERQAKKDAKKTKRWQLKAMNRAEYIRTPIVQRRRQATGVNAGQDHWWYDDTLKCAGLLAHMVRSYEKELQEQATLKGMTPELEAEMLKCKLPPYLQALNLLPPPDAEAKEKHAPIAPEVWQEMAESLNLIVSGERLFINLNSPVWKWLVGMFPDAISFRAYVHSLTSPVLPGGYFPKLKIKIKELGLGTDGSCRAHPDSPIWGEDGINREPCVVQWRITNRKLKLFGKGICVPDESCVSDTGEPEVWLPHNCAKGRLKKRLNENTDKEFEVEVEAGIMRAWDRKAFHKGGFEVWENVRECPRSRELLYQIQKESFDKLREDGVDGLIGKVAAADSNIAMMLKLVGMLKTAGIPVEPLQVQRIAHAVKEKLGRKLYTLAQGTGLRFDQLVIVHDNRLDRGQIVVAGYKPGTEVGCFRFPIVLSQCINTMTIAEPLEAHKINGEQLKNAVFMHPDDVLEYYMGDDDGDTLAISPDPRVVELFKMRLNDDIYMVEPESKKKSVSASSIEGLEHIRYDPRGPVGKATINRSIVLAIKAYNAANACSIGIQEFIDEAKNVVEYSDYPAACNPENWQTDEQGRKSFMHRLGEDDQERPLEVMDDMVERALIDAGAFYMKKDGTIRTKWVLGWRHKGKRIDPDKWKMATDDARYSNLVHFIHDVALGCWKEMETEFNLNSKNPISLRATLPALLSMASNGQFGFQPTAHDWDTYRRDLRKRSGLPEFGRQWKNLIKKGMGREERGELSAVYNNELEAKLRLLTPQELLTIWHWETLTPRDIGVESFEHLPAKTRPRPNLNYAFRGICFEGSIIMEALELEDSPECAVLEGVEGNMRLERMMQIAFAPHYMNAESSDVEKRQLSLSLQLGDNPEARLTEMMRVGTLHGKLTITEEADGVRMLDCPHCRTRVQDNLVRLMRRLKDTDGGVWLRKGLSDVNKRRKPAMETYVESLLTTANYYEGLGQMNMVAMFKALSINLAMGNKAAAYNDIQSIWLATGEENFQILSRIDTLLGKQMLQRWVEEAKKQKKNRGR